MKENNAANTAPTSTGAGEFEVSWCYCCPGSSRRQWPESSRRYALVGFGPCRRAAPLLVGKSWLGSMKKPRLRGRTRWAQARHQRRASKQQQTYQEQTSHLIDTNKDIRNLSILTSVYSCSQTLLA